MRKPVSFVHRSYLVCVGGCDQGIIDALDLRLRTKSVDSSFTSGKC